MDLKLGSHQTIRDSGRYQIDYSADLFAILGLDPEDLQWYDLAMCRGMDTNDFIDNYETNEAVARNTDQICLSCPVIKECLQQGLGKSEWGVWGGVYLTAGKPDQNRNTHKSKETWKKLRDRIGNGI